MLLQCTYTRNVHRFLQLDMIVHEMSCLFLRSISFRGIGFHRKIDVHHLHQQDVVKPCVDKHIFVGTSFKWDGTKLYNLANNWSIHLIFQTKRNTHLAEKSLWSRVWNSIVANKKETGVAQIIILTLSTIIVWLKHGRAYHYPIISNGDNISEVTNSSRMTRVISHNWQYQLAKFLWNLYPAEFRDTNDDKMCLFTSDLIDDSRTMLFVLLPTPRTIYGNKISDLPKQ